MALHRSWGGVVPELSARQHIRDICGVVDQAQMREIPLNGRSFIELAALQSNAVFSAAFTTLFTASFVYWMASGAPSARRCAMRAWTS